MFCKTTLALPRAIVYQSQCSHCSGNIQELFTNLFSLSFFSLRKHLFSRRNPSFSCRRLSFSRRRHLCHADCPGIPAPILTTSFCAPAAARTRSARGASQFIAGYAAARLVYHSDDRPVYITKTSQVTTRRYLRRSRGSRVQIKPFCPRRLSH